MPLAPMQMKFPARVARLGAACSVDPWGPWWLAASWGLVWHGSYCGLAQTSSTIAPTAWRSQVLWVLLPAPWPNGSGRGIERSGAERQKTQNVKLGSWKGTGRPPSEITTCPRTPKTVCWLSRVWKPGRLGEFHVREPAGYGGLCVGQRFLPLGRGGYQMDGIRSDRQPVSRSAVVSLLPAAGFPPWAQLGTCRAGRISSNSVGGSSNIASSRWMSSAWFISTWAALRRTYA